MRTICALATIAVAIAACDALSFDEKEYNGLQQAFIHPPQSARPMVWWHWMNGNITPGGLRKDIEWMHRCGIGGFHVFDAALKTPQMVRERLDYMSPEWKEAFAGAVALADSLGMEVAVASSPGWSSTGGPWVAPADAMKKLTWSTRLLEGGRRIEEALPEPFTVSSRFLNVPLPYEYNHHQDGPIPEWHYEDIAVFAVRMPDSFRTLQELNAKVSASGGTFDLHTLTDGNLDNAGLLPAHPSGFADARVGTNPDSARELPMIVAPGSYTGTITIVTDKDRYSISVDDPVVLARAATVPLAVRIAPRVSRDEGGSTEDFSGGELITE